MLEQGRIISTISHHTCMLYPLITSQVSLNSLAHQPNQSMSPCISPRLGDLSQSLSIYLGLLLPFSLLSPSLLSTIKVDPCAFPTARFSLISTLSRLSSCLHSLISASSLVSLHLQGSRCEQPAVFREGKRERFKPFLSVSQVFHPFVGSQCDINYKFDFPLFMLFCVLHSISFLLRVPLPFIAYWLIGQSDKRRLSSLDLLTCTHYSPFGLRRSLRSLLNDSLFSSLASLSLGPVYRSSRSSIIRPSHYESHCIDWHGEEGSGAVRREHNYSFARCMRVALNTTNEEQAEDSFTARTLAPCPFLYEFRDLSIDCWLSIY